MERELLNDQAQNFLPMKEKMNRSLEEKELMRVSYEKQLKDERLNCLDLQRKIQEMNDVHAKLLMPTHTDKKMKQILHQYVKQIQIIIYSNHRLLQ
jgi:hypothetical protein